MTSDPIFRLSLLAFVALSIAAPASAQLTLAKDNTIVYGHHHIAASDIQAQKRFFVDALGGTKGTTVNHIGFSVPDLRQAVARIKADG